ncbi:hypothetical protein KQI42_01985 [Tissierella sp. MSJ-40]|uniref:Bacterial PH domain-containing protein n=1 Tax=Tissierella simiarum TaxID=2841534 RepID=A0ABS6E1H4_9FIRM|nr:hypothetical protein [Tissierella simiarum]MBU5436757.1 hypothetical protein [Tissierella simiarum]
MEKIKINDKSKYVPLYKVLTFIFGIVFVVTGIKDLEIYKVILGLLFLFYSTYNKEIYVSNEGISYNYSGILFKQRDYFSFQDVDEITIFKHKDNCIIYFIKEPMAKKLIVQDENSEEIIKLVQSIPSVTISFRS